MMRILPAASAVALVLAACGAPPPPPAAPAPAPAPGEGASAGGWRPAVTSLLGLRDELSLTSVQVMALDSLGRDWSSRDDSLRRALRETWGARPIERGDLQRGRPLLEAMAANDQRAADAVGEILDGEQREILCRLQPVQRERVGARPAPRTLDRPSVRGGRRAPPEVRDGGPAPAASGPRGWPWCPPPGDPTGR
jgi:hypothetical protein